MVVKKFKVQDIIVGSFNAGDDLYLSLNKLCKDYNISAGRIEVLGSATSARVNYFYKKKQKFDTVLYKKSMEIVSCIGTISMFNGEPFVHCHISLSDHDGQLYGGHLTEGTKLYTSEFNIAVYEYGGESLSRTLDEQTKLPLIK